MLQEEIQTVVTEFVRNLTSVIEAGVSSRARETVLRAFDGGSTATSGGGLLDLRALGSSETAMVPRPRKKRAKVLCPVPRCTNVAAPVFGMVCGEHRDVAKSKIKKYRAERAARAAS